jgi:hypothetical protein
MAGCCAAAALIHLSVIGEHLTESLWQGTSFILLTAAQLTFSYLLIRQPHFAIIAGIALASAVTAGLWLTSRLGGIALGPLALEAERVGVLDTLASSLELLTALAASYALFSCSTQEATPSRNGPCPIASGPTKALSKFG